MQHGDYECIEDKLFVVFSTLISYVFYSYYPSSNNKLAELTLFCARFEVFTAVLLKIQVFRDVMLCR
jgi:hypothetical protein